VGAARIISRLEFNLSTTTPVGVLARAREISEYIRQEVGIGVITATLTPDGARYVEVHFAVEGGGASDLVLAICGVYGLSSQIRHGSEVAARLLPVPDFPDLLHFLGILLSALGATVAEVGLQRQEHNVEILAVQLGPTEQFGVMDLCDHMLKESISLHETLNCWALLRGSKTPVEIFNWVAKVAQSARERFVKGA
jgi:hypothetical protein